MRVPPPRVMSEMNSERSLAESIEPLEAAVTDADNGQITNARKLEALAAIDVLIPSLDKEEVKKEQAHLEGLCERLLSQNASEPLRRLVISILSSLHRYGDSSMLHSLVERLLKLANDANKKTATNTKVSALAVVGDLMVLHGRVLETFSTDVFVAVAKHMKLSEAGIRVSAFQCLRKTINVVGFKSAKVAENIWKMLQKMVPDKVATVRTAAAQALSALAAASPECVFANGDAMAALCLKALTEEQPGQSSASVSECRSAFAVALAHVLASMASPQASAGVDRSKRKPIVTDFASALSFLEQAAAKGSTSGPMFVSFRAALCLVFIRLAKIQEVEDSASIGLLMRSLLGLLDMPTVAKGKVVNADDDSLAQVGRYVSLALRHVMLMVDSEAVLVEVVEQVFINLAGTQSNEASSSSSDARMLTILEALGSACAVMGDGFRSLEGKVTKPLLNLVGTHSNPFVQLQAAYCLRAVARCSPPQLFQLMSVLLNLTTVQNAELLGVQLPRRNSSPAGDNAAAAQVSADLHPLLRGLFGHCVALASLVSELFHSELGVPHDVTSAVLGTSKALLQPHPHNLISAQRRSCAFLLLEALMCLGADWVGHRLTTLFALWKAALGKKPVDRIKGLVQEHLSSSADAGANADAASSCCRDELLSLLCALRSLHAFTLHSCDTLLTSLPHLHKILVVFLMNISQLLVALPHPMSANLRAKYRSDAGGVPHFITVSTKCGIPEILLMIRSTMYHTFAAMLTTQYSSRFVQLLNMLAHDVTIPLSADFPTSEFLAHQMPPEDVVLDLVDFYSESNKDGAGSTRLAAAALLATKPFDGEMAWSIESPSDFFSEAASASFFIGAPREGPNSVEGLLAPWDAWLDPTNTLASQCTSPEWDWRRSAMTLLAIIMNSTEVSEVPRTQVLVHLLKKPDPGQEAAGQQGNKRAASQQADPIAVPSLAVLTYLREHVKVSALPGNKTAPPVAAVNQILRFSFEGLKEANPVVRRLHVEILALLFYIHYALPDSSVASSIIQHIGSETTSESVLLRSSIALLCGALLRAYAVGSSQAFDAGRKPQRQLAMASAASQCPYLPNVVPLLLRLAKETTQPVRLWMLHAINISMQAVGSSFNAFLKDSLRLATAHLLADFFDAPLVLWVIGALVHSAASVMLAVKQGSDAELTEENVARVLGIWKELQNARYAEPASCTAFATVRAEVLCTSMAHAMVQVAPTALNHLKDILDLVLGKLLPQSEKGVASRSCAVRTAAARCVRDLVVNGHSLKMGAPELAKLFYILDEARGDEAQALQELIRALVKQSGLAQLPMWLQMLKEMILALPPKMPGTFGKEESAPAAEDKPTDDDSAGMNQSNAPDNATYRLLRNPTKVFAVSCVHLLLEQVDPDDAMHFQSESLSVSPSGAVTTGQLAPEDHLVAHLTTLITLASYASNSDEALLAEGGLHLMLMVVQRFRHTRDLAVRNDDVDECPLLLVQFEAQVTTCVRHNLLPQASRNAVQLALQLLRDIVIERACNSPQRLIALLMQPFTSPTFEPDPNFCESTSTRRFLYRLRCACEILDSNMEEQAQQAVHSHLKDLAHWIEHALRDAAVLLTGLPLQSIKTYQPVCFNLTDYKAVQLSFREALPSMLRGICALCSDRSSKVAKPPGAQLSSDLIALSLGIITMLMGERSLKLSTDEVRVYLRCIRQVVSHTLASESSVTTGSDVMSSEYLLDLMSSIWQHVFSVPTRCVALLPDLLGLLHVISNAVWQHRESRMKPTASVAGSARPKVAWLEKLCGDTGPGKHGRAVIGAYAFHCVAAALRSEKVIADAMAVSQALDVFVWWLEDALLRNTDAASGDVLEEALEDGDTLTAAVNAELQLEEHSDDVGGQSKAGDGGRGGRRKSAPGFWLWLLFTSPFPVRLAQAHPKTTLKYWGTVCSLLSAPPPTVAGGSREAQQRAAHMDEQLLHLSLICKKLCRSLLAVLQDQDERMAVYLLAMLVQAASSLCSVLQQATTAGLASTADPGTDSQAVVAVMAGDADLTTSQAGATEVHVTLALIKQVFSTAFAHQNAKIIQAAVSSTQNLLQNPMCAVLCPIVLPALLLALVSPESCIPDIMCESAWGVVPAMVAGQQQQGDGAPLARLTTQMLLSVVSCAMKCHKSTAQRAAMAQCLTQLARVDPAAMKTEVAALPSEAQQSIQQLLREHMSTMSRSDAGGINAGGAPAGVTTAKKIELKLQF